MTSPSPDTRIAKKDSERSLLICGAVLRLANIPEQDIVRITWENYDRDYFARVAEIADLRAALDSIPDQIARAVEAEREACAKAAIDAMAHIGTASSYRPDVRIAAAIRARGGEGL